jgi:hypothetical protein
MHPASQDSLDQLRRQLQNSAEQLQVSGRLQSHMSLLSSSRPLSSFSYHRNHRNVLPFKKNVEDRQHKDVQGPGRQQAQSKIHYYWQGGVRLRRSDMETAESVPWAKLDKSTTSGLTPFQLAMLRSLRQKENTENSSQKRSPRLALSSVESHLQYPRNNGTQQAEVILQRAIGLLHGMH